MMTLHKRTALFFSFQGGWFLPPLFWLLSKRFLLYLYFHQHKHGRMVGRAGIFWAFFFSSPTTLMCKLLVFFPIVFFLPLVAIFAFLAMPGFPSSRLYRPLSWGASWTAGILACVVSGVYALVSPCVCVCVCVSNVFFFLVALENMAPKLARQ